MPQSTIGSLFVQLGINTAQFVNGISSAQKRLSAFGGFFKSFLGGLAGALTVGGLTAAFKSVIDKADELGKTAQKIGIPVEELSKLEFAAKLADVGIDQLSVGIGILSKGMAEIAGGGKGGKVGPALAAIGVSAIDATGKLRPTIDVIGDVAEKFAAMEDGAGKTALALSIFGKSGKELIPLLNAGRDGLAETAAEAEKLGIVIDEKTAKASEDFNDDLTRLKSAMEGLTTSAVKQLIVSLNELTNALVDLVENGSTDQFFTEMNEFIQTTKQEFNALIKVAQTAKALFSGLPSFGPSAVFGGNLSKSSQEISDIWDGTREDLEASVRALADIDSKQKKIVQKIAAPVVAQPDPAAAAAAKQRLREIQRAQEELAESGKRVFASTRTEIENYQIEVNRLRELLRAGAIDQDTFNRAVLQLRDNFNQVGEATHTLGQELGDVILNKVEDLFGRALDGTLKWKDALKDLLKELAKVSFSGLLQGLLQPGSLGGGGFFSKLLGFASGGTIFPGGGGGPDSQLVAFRKSPNERVDITKPGQELTAGGGSMVYNIDARGADAGQIASLRRDLQEMQRNFGKNVLNVVQGEKGRNPRFAS